MIEIVAGSLALLGAGVALAAAIGIVRLPNFLARTHAASLAGSVGAGLVLGAVAIAAPEPGFAIRAVAAFGFLILTTPLAAHLLARTSYRAGETSAEPPEPPSAGDAPEPDATK